MNKQLEQAAHDLLEIVEYDLLPCYGKHHNQAAYDDAKKIVDDFRSALKRAKQTPTLPQQEETK